VAGTKRRTWTGLGKTAAHTGLVWPSNPAELVRAQRELAVLSPPGWQPAAPRPLVGGCYVCFGRSEVDRAIAGERGWAAAALMRGNRGLVESAVVAGAARAPYEPGLLALREGPLLEAALRAVSERPAVLLCNATGRDHPRGAGLALHLGAVLGLPSVGVTDRPLLAEGREPGAERGATSPLFLRGVEVARLLRTRASTRPIVVHPGWRTNLDTAIAVALASTRRARTPEPVRHARALARYARAAAERDRGA
jgi:deoxyribonuclease V